MVVYPAIIKPVLVIVSYPINSKKFKMNSPILNYLPGFVENLT